MTTLANITFLVIVAFIVLSGVAAVAQTASPGKRAQVFLRWLAVGAVWLIGTALPTLLGLVGEPGPVPPQVLFAGVLGFVVLFAASKLGGRIAQAVPLWALVGFQGFRLPLELVLHRWVETGVAPPQMTWTGQNPDIVAGVFALVAVPVVRRLPTFAWLPTLVGIVLLLNIGRIVITSIPGPLHRFPDALTIPSQFPEIWIGTVCVAGAAAAHIITVRALLGSDARSQRQAVPYATRTGSAA